MFRKNKNIEEEKKEVKKPTYPKRKVSIHELRQAVENFAKKLKDGIPLSVLINDDLTIDYNLLTPYLKAIPEDTYYMSKETYEIFPESKKKLAEEIDMVQKAVDKYMNITKELPIIDGDPYHKVSYYKLEKMNLIPYRPDTIFYITDEEFLITYQLKKKKK